MSELTFKVPYSWQEPEQAYAIDKKNAIVIRRTRVRDGWYRYTWADLRDIIPPYKLDKDPPELIGDEWNYLTTATRKSFADAQQDDLLAALYCNKLIDS